MTGDLRIIESDIGPVIPLVDVADNVGRDRSAITKALNKPENRPLFVGLLSTQAIKTGAGTRKCLCITKAGMEALIPLLRPIRRDDMPERIGTFRKSLQVRRSGAHLEPVLSNILTEYGRQARVLATEWGVDLPVAQRVVMATAVERFPDLTPYRALVGAGDKPHDAIQELPAPAAGPKADPDYEKYFSLRKLAQFCQCEEKDARKILIDEGVIAYQNTHPVLTKYGERFGRLFTVTPEAPHRTYEEIRIRYSPDAVQLVRGKLASIQMRLPARVV